MLTGEQSEILIGANLDDTDCPTRFTIYGEELEINANVRF
jgi:hypothetical protein